MTIHASISDRLKSDGDDQQEAVLYIYHEGQDVATAKFLSDEPMFWDWFQQLHDAAKEKNPEIERRLQERQTN